MDEEPFQIPSKLLTLPQGNVPPGLLTAFWTLRADLQGRAATETIDRIIRLRHWRIAREEEQQTERLTLDQRRRLVEAIAREEERAFERIREIEARAIKLKDGRRVYVTDDGYVDEEGRDLKGSAAEEAQHALNPNAATWQEREEAKAGLQETLRLRERAESAKDQDTFDQIEAELDRARQHTSTDIEASLEEYSTDYSALRRTSFAGSIDGPALRSAFAEAQVAETSETKNTPRPLGQGAKLQV